VIVTTVIAGTPLVVMINGAPEAPSDTPTVAGTVTALLLLDKLTTIPPEGALLFRNT